MSRENVEIVEHMLSCFHQGDAAAALACFSQDVVTDATRRPDGATGRGRDRLAWIISDWMGTFDEWAEEVHEIRDLGDRVMVLASQRGRGKGSGVEVESHYATIYGVRAGEIVSLTLYPDRREAFEAAGLSA